MKRKSKKRVLSLAGVDALNILGVGDRNLNLKMQRNAGLLLRLWLRGRKRIEKGLLVEC